MRFKYLIPIVLCLIALAHAEDAPKQTVAKPNYKFEVTSVIGAVRTKEPLITEKPDVFQYDSPGFTANATVKCTTPPNENWTIGFVQQVDSKNARAEYDNAVITTEIPDMPISDTATKTTPWYNVEPAQQAVNGGANESTIELMMLDIPWQKMDWREPLPPFGKQFASQKTLRSVKRDQNFTVWLVAMRDADDFYVSLAKINWEVKIDVVIDCSQPLGKRSKAMPVKIAEPIVQIFNDKTPLTEQQLLKKVMLPPITNSVDQMWWNPKNPKSGERTRLE